MRLVKETKAGGEKKKGKKREALDAGGKFMVGLCCSSAFEISFEE